MIAADVSLVCDHAFILDVLAQGSNAAPGFGFLIPPAGAVCPSLCTWLHLLVARAPGNVIM